MIPDKNCSVKQQKELSKPVKKTVLFATLIQYNRLKDNTQGDQNYANRYNRGGDLGHGPGQDAFQQWPWGTGVVAPSGDCGEAGRHTDPEEPAGYDHSGSGAVYERDGRGLFQ